MTATVSSPIETKPVANGKAKHQGGPNFTHADRRMANEAKQFAHSCLMQLRETLDLSGENARENAQALSSAFKAWQLSRVEWRYAYGKPVPGSRRPLPDAPKKVKPKLRPGPKTPDRPPTPAAACGISTETTPQASTSDPAADSQIAKS